ncbi:hypothetical protein Droror1_Dr00015117 [Drosera rotundifolia]
MDDESRVCGERGPREGVVLYGEMWNSVINGVELNGRPDEMLELVPKLVTLYSTFDLLSDAIFVAESLCALHPLPWNVVISAYVRNRRCRDALEIYEQMLGLGIRLWKKSLVVKIVVKQGVQNTNNKLMAEELKRLTAIQMEKISR